MADTLKPDPSRIARRLSSSTTGGEEVFEYDLVDYEPQPLPETEEVEYEEVIDYIDRTGEKVQVPVYDDSGKKIYRPTYNEQGVMTHDERGIMTFDEWKRKSEEGVDWWPIAKEAVAGLARGFTKIPGKIEKEGFMEASANIPESFLAATEGLKLIGGGVGRFVAKPFRSDEEEDAAEYAAYKEFGNQIFRQLELRKSRMGDVARLFGAEDLAAVYDDGIDPEIADSLSLIFDPTYLVGGGLVKVGAAAAKQAPKVTNKYAKKLIEAAGKAAETQAAKQVGEFLAKPVTSTVSGIGTGVEKVGRGVQKIGEAGAKFAEKAPKTAKAAQMAVGAGTGAVLAPEGQELTGALGGAFGGKVALSSKAVTGLGEKIEKNAQRLGGAAQAAKINSLRTSGLGTVAKIRPMREEVAKQFVTLDNRVANRLLSEAGKLADTALIGAGMGAGIGAFMPYDPTNPGYIAGMALGTLAAPAGMYSAEALNQLARVELAKGAVPDAGLRLRLKETPMHKLASEAVVKRFISALPEQQRVRFVDPDRGLSVADLANQAEAVDLFMGAMRDKGKDVNFFIGNTPEILEKTGGTAREGVAGFYDPDSNTVFVNTDAETPSFTLFHELFHPTERWSAMRKEVDADTGETVKSDPLQDIQTDLAQTIFGTYGPDGEVIQPGLYSKKDMLSFADQYNSRLYPDLSTEIKEVKAAIEAEKKKTLPEIDGIEPPETPEMRLLNRELEGLQTRQEGNQKELAAFDALPDATKRDYMARELMSDYFAMFGESARHGIIRKARNITLKKDYFKDKFLGMNIDRLKMATLGNLRKLLERSGVEFDLAGNPRGEMTATSALFKDRKTGRELVMSPQIEHLIAQYITEKDKLVNRVSETDDVGGSEITLNAKDVLKKNSDGTPKIPEAEIKRWASSGWLKTDKEGNVLNSTGGKWQPGQRPAFTTARERTRMDKNRVAALVTALTPVTQKIDADAPFEPTVKAKQTADGGTNFRGSYFDEQQMDAIMATPDDVIHPDLKSVIKAMNDAIKEGKGAPFLADYWKAITGRGYDSKARMKVQLFTPIGMQISSAGNFNATVFNIGYFENKINRWLGQSGKKKFWSDWADADGRVDVDSFRTDMMELLKTHYENDPSKKFPEGMKKEKLYSFLGVKPEDLSRKDWNRAAKDFKLFISLRFDRMKDVTRGMGDNFPVNYYKAKQRFMPGNEGSFNKAKNTFGTTQDLLEAGYILPDGELLDFSGRHEGADERDVAGQRYSDHREISQAGTDMQAFISSGAVRIDARNGLIETGQEPTGSQYNQIRKIIEDKDSEVYIDLKDPDRNDAAEMFTVIQPEPGTDPKRVIGLIRRFYRGDDISEAVRFMPATAEPRPAQDKLGFFSRVEQVASGNKIPNRGTGEQMLATIAKQPGVKQEEIAWLGLEDFLRGKKQVTKDELVEFIRENDVQLEETMLTETPPDDVRDELISDFVDQESDQYQILYDEDEKSYLTYDPNGEPMYGFGGELVKYGDADVAMDELMFKIEQDTNRMTNAELMQQLGRENVYQEGQPARYQEYQLPGAEPGSYRELLLRLPNQDLDEAIFNNIALLHDLQSPKEVQTQLKFFTTGRKAGDDILFETSPEKIFDRLEKVKSGKAKFNFRSSHFSEPNILSHVRFNDRTGPDGEKILFLEELQSDWHQEGRKLGYAKDSGRPGVPDAPFKSSWHELTLKRMLRYAAENGYDKLAFIDGKETADRYDLSKKIDGLEVIDLDDGTYEILAKEVGDDAYRTLANNVEKDKVEDYIGKEVAKTAFDKMDDGLAHLEGVDLKVGGQWAFNLYDRMIPQFLKKYGKKFGAKVEDVEVGTTEPSPDTTVMIPRDFALREDFDADEYSLFNREGVEIAGGETAQDAVMVARQAGLFEGETLVPVEVEPADVGSDFPSRLSFKAIDITPQMRGEEGVLGGQVRFMPAALQDSVEAQTNDRPSVGVNINDGQLPFSRWIVDGKQNEDGSIQKKTIETRANPQNNALAKLSKTGERFAIISTFGPKKKQAEIIATARAGSPIMYDTLEKFRADQDKHMVKPGSDFDWDGFKVGYPIEDVRKLEKPVPVPRNVRGIQTRDLSDVRYMPAERNDRKNRVSTRLPTAAGATEDPIASTLLIGNDTIMMLPPEKQEVMAGIIANYPHIKTKKRDLPVVGDELMNMSVSNLLWLYDKVPEDVRKRSKLWYDGARKITNDWVKKYGTSNAESAGVIAVLSPQKDWFMNVSLAERVIDAYKNKQDVAVNQDMIAKASEITQFSKDELIMKVIRSMKNKKYADLDPLEKAYFMRLYDQTYRPQSFPVISPEGKMLDVKMNDNGTVGKVIHASSPAYMKAISILENPTKENISTQLGGQHKVRNFNNNILLPKLATEDVTIDTHAVAAALLKPLSAKSIEVGHNFGSGVPNSSITGGKGTYGIYADAYRKAAEQRGVMPREMQSITWEAVRGLFPQRMKNKKNNKIVDDIWGEYNRGKISLDEARDKISDAFGGIRNPSWYGRDK